MRSDDEQMRWMPPQNLTPNGLDAKFGALANLVDSEVHIAYQIDPIVGEMIPDTLAPIARERNNIEVLFLHRSTLADPSSIDHGDANVVADLNAKPNPAHASVSISFAIGRSGDAVVRLVDLLGRTLLSLHDGFLSSGTHTRALELAEIEAGVYYIVVEAAGSARAMPLRVVR
jgi:hypothetical protein